MQFIIEEFSDAVNAVFSKKNSPGYSVELEYIFPFNRYKWSIFLKPTSTPSIPTLLKVLLTPVTTKALKPITKQWSFQLYKSLS